MLPLMLTGCGVAVSDIALAGDSVYDMRRTGRNVIAIYDAGVGR